MDANPLKECPSVLHVLQSHASGPNKDREVIRWPQDPNTYIGITVAQLWQYVDRLYHNLFMREPNPPAARLLSLFSSPSPSPVDDDDDYSDSDCETVDPKAKPTSPSASDSSANMMSHRTTRPWVGILLEDNRDFFFTVLAMQRAGFATLLLSPRNALSSIKQLCRQCQCRALVVSSRTASLVTKIRASDFTIVTIPAINLQDLDTVPRAGLELVPPLAPAAPYEIEEVRFCLHSSGTTKAARPVFYRNRAVLANCTVGVSVGLNGFSLDETRLAVAPLCHTLGFITVWGAAVVAAVKVVLPVYATWPPTVEELLRILMATEPTSVTFVPSLLQQVVQRIPAEDPRWDIFRRIRSITFGGAMMPPYTLEKLLEQKLRINSAYGTTEVGCTMMGIVGNSRLGPLPMKVVDNIPHKFIPHPDQPDQLELVFRRDAITLADGVCNCAYGFKTGDLFKRGGESGTWIYCRRTDDTIVHSNGEKTNPVPMESQMLGFPVIASCVLAGQNRPAVAALIELNWSLAAALPLNELMEDIFSAVTAANLEAPSHSHIMRELIYVLPRDRHLVMSSKGVPVRSKCEKTFSRELDRMYAKLGDPETLLKSQRLQADAELPKSLPPTALNNKIFRCVRVALAAALDKPIEEIDEEEDTCFFELGLDSQGAMVLRDEMERRLRIALDPSIAYGHPTARLLVEHLTSKLGSCPSSGPEPQMEEKAFIRTLALLLEKADVEIDRVVPLHKQGLNESLRRILHHLLVTVTGARLPADFLEEFQTVDEIVTRIASGNYVCFPPVHNWDDTRYLIRRYRHLIEESGSEWTNLGALRRENRLPDDAATESTNDVFSRHTFVPPPRPHRRSATIPASPPQSRPFSNTAPQLKCPGSWQSPVKNVPWPEYADEEVNCEIFVLEEPDDVSSGYSDSITPPSDSGNRHPLCSYWEVIWAKQRLVSRVAARTQSELRLEMERLLALWTSHHTERRLVEDTSWRFKRVGRPRGPNGLRPLRFLFNVAFTVPSRRCRPFRLERETSSLVKSSVGLQGFRHRRLPFQLRPCSAHTVLPPRFESTLPNYMDPRYVPKSVLETPRTNPMPPRNAKPKLTLETFLTPSKRKRSVESAPTVSTQAATPLAKQARKPSFQLERAHDDLAVGLDELLFDDLEIPDPNDRIPGLDGPSLLTWGTNTSMNEFGPHVETEDQKKAEVILRRFDMTSKFGSCRGLSRMERYEAAQSYNLNPPEIIKQMLLRFGSQFDRSVFDQALG